MVDRLDEKRGDFCRLLIGRGFPGCECLPTHRQNTWGSRHSARPAATSSEYTSGKASPSPAGPVPTETRFLRQPTHPLTEVVSSPERASIRRRDGRSFRGGPRAPIPAQTFEEGQDAPSIHRAAHRPLAIPRNELPEHPPAGMSPYPKHWS